MLFCGLGVAGDCLVLGGADRGLVLLVLAGCMQREVAPAIGSRPEHVFAGGDAAVGGPGCFGND